MWEIQMHRQITGWVPSPAMVPAVIGARGLNYFDCSSHPERVNCALPQPTKLFNFRKKKKSSVMGEEDLLFCYVIFTSHPNKQIWSWFRKSSQELGCLTGQPLHHCHEAWRNGSWHKGMKKTQNLSLIVLSPLGPSLLRGEQIWACSADPAVSLSLFWQLGWDLLCPQDLLSDCLGRETCLSNPALWGRSGIWCLSFRSAALLFHTATPSDPSFSWKKNRR